MVVLFQSQNGLILVGAHPLELYRQKKFQSQNGLILVEMLVEQMPSLKEFQSQNGLILVPHNIIWFAA